LVEIQQGRFKTMFDFKWTMSYICNMFASRAKTKQNFENLKRTILYNLMLSVLSPKLGTRGSKMKKVMWPISRLEILYRWRKYILSWVGKPKQGPQSPKTELGAQNSYGDVIHPSIGNFTCSKKKYSLGGQKGVKKPSEPKNGI
jgi:hypothetical protein